LKSFRITIERLIYRYGNSKGKVDFDNEVSIEKRDSKYFSGETYDTNYLHIYNVQKLNFSFIDDVKRSSKHILDNA